MEKKSLSAVDISKKLIWEYIVSCFILSIISYLVIGFSTKNMENNNLKLIIQIIANIIIVFGFVWIGSRNIIQRYFIKQEDVSIIIRNIGIFFIVVILLGFISNYNSYQKIIEKETRIASFSGNYDIGDIVSESINRYENNGSYADMYSNIKEKQAEKTRKEISKEYGYLLLIPFVCDVGLYGTMILLQRKWLLQAAE